MGLLLFWGVYYFVFIVAYHLEIGPRQLQMDSVFDTHLIPTDSRPEEGWQEVLREMAVGNRFLPGHISSWKPGGGRGGGCLLQTLTIWNGCY